MLKDQLFEKGGLQFDNWVFWPAKFPGLSRNGPLVRMSQPEARKMEVSESPFDR